MFGGPGDDTILAADGQRDLVDCGPGDDTAYVDELDEVAANCEEVFVAQEQQPSVCQNPERVLTVPSTSSDTVGRTFTTTGSFFRVNYLLDFTDTAPTPRSATLTIVRVSDQQVVRTQSLSETTSGVPSSFDVNAGPGTYELRVDIEPNGAATYSVSVDQCGGTTPPPADQSAF